MYCLNSSQYVRTVDLLYPEAYVRTVDLLYLEEATKHYAAKFDCLILLMRLH